jgi:hypothetical protein
MTTPTAPHITVKWHGRIGGWAMECPLCGALAVRDQWESAQAEADRHLAAHHKLGWLT